MTAIGAAAPRSDADTKVRGTATYGVDVSLPGMIHGAIMRSPVARGRIRRIDTSKAESMPGVWAVITASDAPSHRTGLKIRDERMFATDLISFEGEPIAAVAAESRELARRAVAAIEVDIEETQPVVDMDFALTGDSPLVHPEWDSYETVGDDFPRGGNVCAEMSSDPEGVTEAFAIADHIIEDEYRSQRQYQAYLEPKGAVAIYEGGRYTVHIAHQYPFRVRDRLAEVLGISSSDVRIVGHHIGGGFGAKLDVSLEPYAALLARATGRPVKIVYERSEDLITCQSREDAIFRVRSAIASDGRILGREIDVLINSGAAGTDGPYLASIAFILAGAPYRVGPTRVRCRSVYTNTAPTGAYRGVSGTHVIFALERHTDHIAQTLDVDRREFRLKNLITDGHTLLNGQVLPDAGIFAQAFDAVEEKAPWAERAREPYTGVGIAATVWLTNPQPGSVILKLNEDGRLGVITGATENGSGAVAMGVTQIAAEELRISPDQVVVTMPDTDTSPYDAGSQGSRTTHVVGRAVGKAASELRQKIYEIAATMLEAAVEDLELVDGGVAVKGSPGSKLTLTKIATQATAQGESLTATGAHATPQPKFDPTCASGLLFPTFPTPTYHVHLAEVRVDPVTGNVEVLRYVVAQEVGTVVNPLGIEGQVQGGVAQGLGYALWENLTIGEDGRYQQRNLESYRLPLATDVPRVETIILEHPDEGGPYGAKGVAEPPIVPVAAAIANAVSDAVGAPIDTIPITPQAVLEALSRSGR
ncbi:MAG: xanthine dehydrogenase family protein molybdopterin-binding subunit [Acidimicrobiia bacterium]